jgi:hypothetical protein
VLGSLVGRIRQHCQLSTQQQRADDDCRRELDRVRVFSRRGNDPRIADGLAALNVMSITIDGEGRLRDFLWHRDYGQ